MKKMLFVAVLALAVLAFASTALAYEAWDSTAGGNGSSLPTPHKDYQLSTVKCGVCHAAHNADTTGEVLLRSTIANACTYCHIDTAIGGKQIYNADPNAYTVSNDYGHNAVYGYSCSSCHSVHGASTWNFSNTDGAAGSFTTAVNSKILRQYTSGSHVAWGGAGDAAAPAGYGRDDAANRDMAVTAFCTQCHYSMFAQDSQTERNFSHGGPADPGYTHPLVRDSSLSVFSPALKAGSTVAFNGQVAYKNTEACRSCHDAGTVDDTGVILSSFPHYTPGAAAFLMAATNVDGVKSNATESTWDGVCLKCHVNGPSAQTQGVGLNF